MLADCADTPRYGDFCELCVIAEGDISRTLAEVKSEKEKYRTIKILTIKIYRCIIEVEYNRGKYCG